MRLGQQARSPHRHIEARTLWIHRAKTERELRAQFDVSVDVGNRLFLRLRVPLENRADALDAYLDTLEGSL